MNTVETTYVSPHSSNAMLGDVYEEILQLFVSKEDFREWMKTPFLVGNKAVATDAHFLVAVPEWNGNYEQSNKAASAYPMFVDFRKEYSIEQFKDAIAQVPLVDGFDEEIKVDECDECNGEGEVEFEYYANGKYYYHDADCPVCEGEGQTEVTKQIPNGTKVPDSTKQIRIRLGCFSIEAVQRLIKVAELLNEKTVTLVNQKGNNSAAMFHVGQCEVLLMPLMNHGEEQVAANIA